MALYPTSQDVYVLEDDPLMREMIAAILKAEGYSAVFFADAASLISTARKNVPLCILLDLYLPGVSGLDVLNSLRSQGWPGPIILISGIGDITAAVQALKMGADDYIEKPFHAKDFIARLEQAVDKHAQQRPQVAARLLLPGLEALTGRETEILESCVTGASAKETAAKLGISPRTVEDHRLRIMRKLRVKNVAELVRITVEARRTPPTDT